MTESQGYSFEHWEPLARLLQDAKRDPELRTMLQEGSPAEVQQVLQERGITREQIDQVAEELKPLRERSEPLSGWW